MKSTLPLSSFPLQGLLITQKYFHFAIVVGLFLLIMFKTYSLAYTGAMSVQEGIIFALFLVYMQARIKLGIGANKTEDSTQMAIFLILTLVGLFFGIYYIFLQYYVLLVEEVVFSLMMVFNVLEVIIGFFACWQFQSYEKQH